MELIRGTGDLVKPEGDKWITIRYTIVLIPPAQGRLGRWYGNYSIATPGVDPTALIPFFGQKLQLNLEDGRTGEVALTSLNRFTGSGPLE